MDCHNARWNSSWRSRRHKWVTINQPPASCAWLDSSWSSWSFSEQMILFFFSLWIWRAKYGAPNRTPWNFFCVLFFFPHSPFFFAVCNFFLPDLISLTPHRFFSHEIFNSLSPQNFCDHRFELSANILRLFTPLHEWAMRFHTTVIWNDGNDVRNYVSNVFFERALFHLECISLDAF